MNYTNQVIWIIGASSGIGEALAKEMAARGATLALSARRVEALTALQTGLGAQHKVFALDVTDAERVIRTAQAIAAAFGRIDRVIFLSAAYTPMPLNALDLTLTAHMLNVNVMGAFHVVHAVLPILTAQPSGQIALCGSVAGYIGLPDGQPYCATKAAVNNLAESMRTELPPHIDVKLICPGFVQSELTAKNDFKMPMIITAPEAATFIANGLLAKPFEIHFPKRFTLWLKLLRVLPYALAFKITKTFKK